MTEESHDEKPSDVMSLSYIPRCHTAPSEAISLRTDARSAVSSGWEAGEVGALAPAQPVASAAATALFPQRVVRLPDQRLHR